MARFFFDLREGASVLRDDEGVELANAEAAELQAVKAAAAIAEENFRKGNRAVEINVREDSRPAFKISLRVDVDRA
ncbi:glutamate dehydrogenase leucine dehydrogenase [Afipia sp. P52-10]|jgi:hypothetical protein|uniref:DUF6894 family protein n=1 Tax=Afipia sp. P52-10 TaxID=1429916 RepID=UPI0003DF1DE9|nr:hypothetical protein [Afipia sp. P52-10]ETR76312.1 glutamate dehydrogenase leucine dehydrogenase [Afipia sp. P52-10]